MLVSGFRAHAQAGSAATLSACRCGARTVTTVAWAVQDAAVRGFPELSLTNWSDHARSGSLRQPPDLAASFRDAASHSAGILTSSFPRQPAPLLGRLAETPVCFPRVAGLISIWTALALDHRDLVNAVQAAAWQHSSLHTTSFPEGDSGALSVCRLLEQRGILLPAKLNYDLR